MNENAESKTHWFVESMGGVNIVVLGGALIAASWYVIEIRAGQGYLAEKISHLEVELEALVDRDTEIAQLGWRLENLHNEQNRHAVQIENLQDAVRAAQGAIRDLQRVESR